VPRRLRFFGRERTRARARRPTLELRFWWPLVGRERGGCPRYTVGDCQSGGRAMHITTGTDGVHAAVTRPNPGGFPGMDYAARRVGLRRDPCLAEAETRFAAAAPRLSTLSVRTSSARRPRTTEIGRRAASASSPFSYAATIPGWM
jgi:hypothetical protein